MSALLETRINPFERIRSTEGKVFLLLVGVALLGEVFDLIAPATVGWTLAEATGTLAYLGLGTYGTMRIVARPVRRATAHFEAIGRGDYTRPVRTRRTDEFGDMLRGLEHMRQNLCAAVAARDAAELK
jgi:methyl-accepting chemotaxis protein